MLILAAALAAEGFDMAGLLDLWEIMADTGNYFQRRNREQNANKLADLQTQYQGQPIHMGIPSADQPSSGAGGLLNQNQVLPPQYYNRASTIPGYEQFGLQQQQGDQSMQRQTQEQGWSQNNMTAAQQAQQQLEQQQMAMQQQYQQAQLVAQAAERAAVQSRFETSRADTLPGGLLYQAPQAPKPDQNAIKAYEDDLKAQSDYAAALDYYDKALEQLATGGGSIQRSPEALTLDSSVVTAIGPAYARMMGTGSLNEGDVYTIQNELTHRFAPTALGIAANAIPFSGDVEEKAAGRLIANRDRFRQAYELAAKKAGRPAPKWGKSTWELRSSKPTKPAPDER
jgi:hypothetical protein